MEKEIELLEKVELRLALASDESSFESQITTLLCPILAKLDSPHQQVKTKAMAVCSHINKRCNSGNINLPVDKLIEFYHSSGPTSRAFAIIYLKKGFTTLNETDQMLKLPGILKGISKKPTPQQMVLFSIALPILANYNIMFVEKHSIVFEEADVKYLVSKFLDFMLYSVPQSGRKITALNAAELAALPPISPLDALPAGLSKSAVNFITNEVTATWTMNSTALKDLKVGIAKFLMIERLVPKDSLVIEKFLVFLVASVDPFHEVQFVGEDGLRRYAKPDMENEYLINRLYLLYLGHNDPKDPSASRQPASVLLKNRIVDYMLKSVLAANKVPFMINMSFDALYNPHSTPKLRSNGMAFVYWMAKMTRNEIMKPIGKLLIEGISKLLDEQQDAGLENIRGLTYESIGMISKKVPELFQNDLEIAKRFLTSIPLESPNVRVSLQDALVSLLPAYRGISEELKKELQILLLENIDSPEHQSRYISLKYAIEIYDFTDVTARYISLLATADSKLEIRELSFKGLELPTKDSMDSIDGGFLADLVDSIQNYSSKRTIKAVSSAGVSWIGNLTVTTFSFALAFLRQILFRILDSELDLGKISIDSTERENVPSSKKILESLSSLWRNEDTQKGLKGYITFLEKALDAKEADGLLLSLAASNLLELISISPEAISKAFESKIDWADNLLKSSKYETRISMAHIVGILSTAGLSSPEKKADFAKRLERYISTANDLSKNNFEYRHGSIAVLGYCVGRLVYRYSTTFKNIISTQLLSKVLESVFAALGSDNISLILGGCIAIAEMGRYGTFTSLDESLKAQLQHFQDKLSDLIKYKEPKVQEMAIFSLSHLALGTEFIAKPVLDLMLTLPSLLAKHVELQFNIGEALCSLLFKFHSLNMLRYLDIADVTFPPNEFQAYKVNEALLEEYMNKIFALVAPAQNAINKKAGCIWLLCITKYGKNTPFIQKNLLQLHQNFSDLLNDKDDFTQEIASKGIGLIYEIGDADMKKELVSSLVSTFTAGKKLAPQSVSGTTELLPNAALGGTPDGSNISTYQDILSLAADMNQPDLVYKFMSLASHHAIWNSRRGASLGFSSIAMQAEKDLEPILPSLVPRLYRYSFDPHPKTAQGMKNIWNSLVKEPAKTIDKYFVEIMNEVLKGMGDRMWRTREASSAALTDLLSGKTIEQLEPFMTELWTMSFRALDDIKESVRKAAFLAAKTLMNITVRYCDPVYHSPSKSQKIMNEMMPFLLQKGLVNNSEEVKAYSLSTILKLTKTGGVLLKPHIVELVCTLMEALSSLEPQSMNYLAFHASSYNISQSDLETSRMTAAKSSPIMEAIDRCVPFIDAEILAELSPKLAVIVRKGVGLPTRAGAARFIYTLVQSVPNELRAVSEPLIKALSVAIYDRSPVVRKSFSTAFGYLAKLVEFSVLEKIINQINSKYLEANDEEGRMVAPVTYLEISRHSPSAIQDFHGLIIPLAFMGSRDKSQQAISEVWKNIWDENTGGSSLAIKKWKLEIFESCKSILVNNPSWDMKKQVGKALVDFSKSLDSDILEIMPACLALLIDSLSGRTWSGKEALLEALMSVCIAGKDYFGTRKEELGKIEAIFIREAQKKNMQYKRFSIEYMGIVFDELNCHRFGDVFEYLANCAEEKDVDMDDDVDESISKPLILSIRASAFKAVGGCFPSSNNGILDLMPGEYIPPVGQFLERNLVNNVWNIRVSVLGALKRVFEKLGNLNQFSDGLLRDILKGLLQCLDDGKVVVC
ncbi:hypothetical protein HK103_005242 [Boothiomyces macroporosus]|uniref:Proteasome component ECM29 n=1 Tax=Boothiomyces macroporosus TaxID=261099 RepID=A0AAD5UJ26_9FUNG|nr:hypothetical protein HK103_005242 [Boothiomyces macroporosus]